MISSAAPTNEFFELMCMLAEGQISVQQADRLEELLWADPANQAYYVDFMLIVAGLHRTRGSDGSQTRLPLIEQGSSVENEQCNSQPFVSFPHAPSFLSDTIHTPVDSLSGWPVAYLIAMVIFGIGALIGAFTYVSQPVQVARESLPAAKERVASEPQGEFVGRITGVVDCKWADPQTKAFNGAYVPFGGTYALTSGLMEITYNTGAKVTLEGPVTYTAESAIGGYLAIGKLIARVESLESRVKSKDKVASGQWPVASKSEILNPPLFTIKTPTVIVTDLGTEFGIEVTNDGSNEVHVLDGRVRVELINASGQILRSVLLKTGEGRLCRADKSEMAAIPADHRKFRQIHIVTPTQRWKAYSRQLQADPTLVAYYTFEPHHGNTSTLPNQSIAGSEMDAEVINAEWVNGRLPGKLALLFHGPDSDDKVILSQPDRFAFDGTFSVAVWFKARQFNSYWQSLIIKGDDSWRLHQHINTNRISFDTNYEVEANQYHNILAGQSNVKDNRWHLAVAVYESVGDRAIKRLYIDGRLDAKGESPIPLHQNDAPVSIGVNDTHLNRNFDGWIDEVAIFTRALSTEEIKVMYDTGNPMNH